MKKLLLFCSLFAIMACTKKAVESDARDTIDWYKGSVESAMKEAKALQKPMLLYWGAVWCPSCNQVKASVFPHPDFVKASRSFINIYLDGDKDEAQKWGERLKVVGYPTLMVL